MTQRQLFRKAARIVGALIALVLLLLWFSGAFVKKIDSDTTDLAMPASAGDLRTAVVEEASVPVLEEAAGTVQAERKTLVSARIVAAIREVRVRAGEQVAAGDLLVVLDDRELSATVEEGQRVVDAATARRRQAKAEFDRAQRLLHSGVISRAEFDDAESAFRVAAAELERAGQSLQRALVALTYTEIRAPVGGRVIDRLADQGDTALPGEPLLSLYDPTALRIEVPVRERLVGSLNIGQRLQVRLGTDAGPIEGVVDEIVPQAEAGSRTFLIKVSLPRQEGMYTGMFGRVLIPAGERKRLLIPTASVDRVGQLDFVGVVGKQGQRTRRLVTLGPPADQDRVEVLSGLRPGETVLLNLIRKSPVESRRSKS